MTCCTPYPCVTVEGPPAPAVPQRIEEVCELRLDRIEIAGKR
jgi:hypothetical protein